MSALLYIQTFNYFRFNGKHDGVQLFFPANQLYAASDIVKVLFVEFIAHSLFTTVSNCPFTIDKAQEKNQNKYRTQLHLASRTSRSNSRRIYID